MRSCGNFTLFLSVAMMMKPKHNFLRNAFALEAMKLVATKVKSKKRYNRKKEKKVKDEQ